MDIDIRLIYSLANQMARSEAVLMKYVVGGIGDFLQVLGSAQKETAINVLSHYSKAKDFFSPFTHAEVQVYHDPDELLQYRNLLEKDEPLTRETYPEFDVPISSFMFAKAIMAGKDASGRKVIGIHPIGSPLSNKYWYQRGQPLKFIPEQFIEKIIDDENFYLLFGSPKDLANYPNLLKRDNFMAVSYANIWDSLAFVEHCTEVIACDSAIKTMSAIRKIPTTVLVGNYPDEFRDKMFLEPYVKDGVMKVIKFLELDDDVVKEINGRN
jgi:ADP-heptose:LPS heptosyltransferase